MVYFIFTCKKRLGLRLEFIIRMAKQSKATLNDFDLYLGTYINILDSTAKSYFLLFKICSTSKVKVKAMVKVAKRTPQGPFNSFLNWYKVVC